MALIGTLLLTIFLTLVSRNNAQTFDKDGNLGRFLNCAAANYASLMMDQSVFQLPNKTLQGGGVTSNFIIDLSNTYLMGVVNLTLAPATISQTGGVLIQIKVAPNSVAIYGNYGLKGLFNSKPKEGEGTLLIHPDLTELNIYFRTDVEGGNILRLTDSSGYYSSYVPGNLSFSGLGTSDTAYERTVATAISQDSLNCYWEIYHNASMAAYLNNILQGYTLQDILDGNFTDCTVMPSPTTPKPATTPPEDTTPPTISTTTLLPTMDCEGRPDGYYPHPSDCKKYVGCLNQQMFVYVCPGFTVFDPNRIFCVHPSEFSCEVNTTEGT